jgi:hypothetical protein
MNELTAAKELQEVLRENVELLKQSRTLTANLANETEDLEKFIQVCRAACEAAQKVSEISDNFDALIVNEIEDIQRFNSCAGYAIEKATELEKTNLNVA